MENTREYLVNGRSLVEGLSRINSIRSAVLRALDSVKTRYMSSSEAGETSDEAFQRLVRDYDQRLRSEQNPEIRAVMEKSRSQFKGVQA